MLILNTNGNVEIIRIMIFKRKLFKKYYLQKYASVFIISIKMKINCF